MIIILGKLKSGWSKRNLKGCNSEGQNRSAASENKYSRKTIGVRYRIWS